MSLVKCEQGLDQLDLILERSKRITSPVRTTQKSVFFCNIRKGGRSGVVDFTLVLTIQRPNGDIVRWGQKLSTPSAAYAGGSWDLKPQIEGFLLKADIYPYSHSYGTQVFIQLNLYELGVNESDIDLIKGYPDQILSWPDHVGRAIGSEPGTIMTVVGTDPAAGQEFSHTVPAGVRWELISLQAPLVTDATVSNRVAQFIVDDGVNTLFFTSSVILQAASLTINYNLYPIGYAQTNYQSRVTVPIPDFTLLTGWRVRSVTFSMQAGDNWGPPILTVKEWVTQ